MRSARWTLIALAALAPVAHADAETLALEYERVLVNQCAGLDLAHDASGQVLPGQLGSELKDYCEGTSPAGGVPVRVFDDDYTDPILLVGPPTGDRVTSLPGWRERRVRGRQARESTTDGFEADTNVLLGFHPGINHAGGGGYAEESATSFGIVLGVQHWFSAVTLVSLTGAIRENGYAAASSAVWAPNERSFGEVRINYDRVDTKVERAIEHASTSPANVRGVSWDFVAGRPSRTFFGSDVAFGYDFGLSSLSIGPRIGMSYGYYDQSSYAEVWRYTPRELPLSMVFDSTSADSLAHRIGFSIAMNSTRQRLVAPSLEITWSHEYLDVQRVMTGQLLEDMRSKPTMLTFVTPDRPRDSISARLGFGFRVAARVTVFASGEIRYDEHVRQANGLIGARGKF